VRFSTRGVQKHHKKLFWKKHMTKTFLEKAHDKNFLPKNCGGKYFFPVISPLRYFFYAFLAFLCVLRAAHCCKGPPAT
jgi:hypothetical protein